MWYSLGRKINATCKLHGLITLVNTIEKPLPILIQVRQAQISSRPAYILFLYVEGAFLNHFNARVLLPHITKNTTGKMRQCEAHIPLAVVNSFNIWLQIVP